MTNAAAQAIKELRALGHSVEVSTHKTSWGSSTYISARRSTDAVWVERKVRISDHEVGEFRRATDGCNYLSDDCSVEQIIDLTEITDDKLEAAHAAVVARRAEDAAKFTARLIACNGSIGQAAKLFNGNRKAAKEALANLVAA